MTVVMKQVQKNAGIKSVLDDLVVAVDGNSDQLLLFDDNYKKVSILTHLLTHQLTHVVTYSLTHSLTHSLTNSLT
jgi:hypothetical protein